jgi:GH24 family phage-related lysozyme (muramidase)
MLKTLQFRGIFSVEAETSKTKIEEVKQDDLELVFDFVKSFEWLRLTAYWDVTRRSIWYWTKSYRGETITEEEAKKRKVEVIQRDIARYWLENKPLNVKKAVISFVYNLGSLNSYQIKLLKDNNYCRLGDTLLVYNTAGGKYLEWLNKRRQQERRLLCDLVVL